MTIHTPDLREYEVEGRPVKRYRITCSCGAIVQRDDSTLIWFDYQLHIMSHQITELDARIKRLET